MSAGTFSWIRSTFTSSRDSRLQSAVRVARPLAEWLESRLLFADTRFAVLGDFSAGQGLADVSSLIKSWNPSYVVTVGDNNYDSHSAATYDSNIGQYFHQYIYPYKGSFGAGSADNQNHFFPSLGNHDLDFDNGAAYLAYFTLPGNERYYTTRQDNVELFVLDSDQREQDGRTSTSIQANWLKSQLAASTAKWKLVVLHHPPYSSGSHGNDSEVQWPFQQWGATAVLSGHDHDYERLNINGTPYFVVALAVLL